MMSCVFSSHALSHRPTTWYNKTLHWHGAYRRGLRTLCGGAVCSPCRAAPELAKHPCGVAGVCEQTMPIRVDVHSRAAVVTWLGARRPKCRSDIRHKFILKECVRGYVAKYLTCHGTKMHHA